MPQAYRPPQPHEGPEQVRRRGGHRPSGHRGTRRSQRRAPRCAPTERRRRRAVRSGSPPRTGIRAGAPPTLRTLIGSEASAVLQAAALAVGRLAWMDSSGIVDDLVIAVAVPDRITSPFWYLRGLNRSTEPLSPNRRDATLALAEHPSKVIQWAASNVIEKGLSYSHRVDLVVPTGSSRQRPELGGSVVRPGLVDADVVARPWPATYGGSGGRWRGRMRRAGGRR